MDSLRNMSKELQSKQSGERGRRGVTATDLRFNDLIFENIANASLISQRHDEIFNSVSIDYGSGASSVDFVFQSGEQLVDPKNSCIEFDLVVSTGGNATTFNFDTGSVMNIFSDVILHSKGGDEIDRLQSAGIYRANADVHEPKDWFDTVGELMGYGGNDYNMLDNNQPKLNFFQVPLNKVLNVFSNDLIPAQMISGARLQLILNRNKRYLFKHNQDDALVTYELKNVRMVLSLLRPTDAVLRELKKMSINTGLVYTWPAVYTQKNKADTSLNEQVSKSVARATLVRVCPLNGTNANVRTELNVTPKVVNYSQSQIRCGSSYFPQYRLQDPQIYRNSLSAVGKLGHPVRYNKTDSKANADVWCTSLETHGLISYSGVSLNNSRVLYIESTFNTLTANGECFIFVEYMKTARCYETSLATDE